MQSVPGPRLTFKSGTKPRDKPLNFQREVLRACSTPDYISAPRHTNPFFVLADGSFTATSVPIQEGFNAITAEGTNQSGQSDTDTVIVTYSPELPPLNVTILTPVDGSILDTSRFELNGHVSDPDASVLVNDIPARVEEGFFNATVFSCVPPGPLAMQFEGEEPGEPLPPGACTITVRAYSGNGATASQVINVTFVPSETPLSVVIIDPTRDRVFTHSPIEITGKITDVLSGFTPTSITVNGVPGVVQGETFSAFIPLTDGLNDISVHAENLVGIDAYDTSRVIYEPPTSALTLLVTSPVDPFIVNHSPITVSGVISDSTAIVDVNGSTAAQDFRSFKVLSVPLSLGRNTLTVTAVRPNNETVTASLSVIYDPKAPSPPPPVLSPLPAFLGEKVTIANGARFLNMGLGVAGLSGPFFEVEVLVNGVIYPKVQADDTGFFKTTVLLFEDGPYHLAARTIDLSGNMSALSDEQVVIKDTTAPRILARVHGRRIGLAASQVEINGFTEPFTDVAISIFNVFPKNIKLVSDARGHFSTLTHMNAGEHDVSIAATDRAGNTGRNSKDFWTIHPTRSAELATVPIAPTIDPLPSPIQESRISIEGNAYRDAHLDIYRNNILVGTVITDQRGRFHFEDLPLLPGTNILKVKQEKYRFGRHGGLLFFEPPARFLDPVDSPEVIVEVITGSPVIPEVAITFPPDGAVTNEAFLPLRGTVSDPRAEIRVSPTYLLGGKAQNRGGSFVSEGKIPLIPGKNVLWVEAIAPDGSRAVDKVTVFSDGDAEVPSIKLTSPKGGEEVYDSFISVTGTIDESVQTVIVNEVDAVITGSGFTSNFVDLTKWHYMVNLSDLNRKGNALINAWAMDAQGRIGADEGSLFFRDLPVPKIFLNAPLEGGLLTASPVTVTGQVFDASEVTVNGRLARIDGEFFTIQMDLVEGPNTFTVIARNPGKAATETITVEFQPAQALVSLEIVSSASQIPLGNALNLKAVGIRAGGTQVDLTQAVLWHSSAPTVALVNAAGFVTSLEAGGSTISATFQGLSANLSLTVDSPALQSIRIAYEDPFLVQLTTGAPALQVGELRSMLALGTFSDGALIDLKKSFFPTTWISSDPAVATVDATGLVSALKAGITELRASSAGVTGRTNLVVTPPPMHLFITDPVAGGAATHDEITVSGIVITEAPEVGITVKGLLANVFGDRFVVNGVPLDPGSNTFTAQAVDSNGAAASAEVTISSSPTTKGITLRSNISSGVAPLVLSLNIDSTFGAFSGSTLSFNGPAVPQINQVSPEGYRVTLTTEGIYSFTAQVTDGQGTVHRDETTVVVLNFSGMDALMREKWGDFKDALVNKDVSKALENVVEESRPKYRRLFEQFGNALPEIATNLPALKFIRIIGDVAAYYVIKLENGVEKAHFVYFSRGSEGFWRLHKF